MKKGEIEQAKINERHQEGHDVHDDKKGNGKKVVSKVGVTEVDVLIKNGLVVDGSLQPAVHKDVAFKGNRLLVLDPLSSASGNAESGSAAVSPMDFMHNGQKIRANEVINATGLVVAPGFIDIHTHSDLTLLVDSRGASKVSQGVTTEIIGNCGLSVAPAPVEMRDKIKDSLSILFPEHVHWNWTGYRDYVQLFREQGVSMNVGFYIGHGTVRAAAMGFDDRQPTESELARMKEYIIDGMQNGAVGLSSGLIYPPGVFADTDELVELCKVVAQYGGIYSTHMRNEGDQLLDSIEEALEVSVRSGVSLQISHLKAGGKQNWGKLKQAVKRIEAARAAGVDVHYDFYPYNASSTYLSALLPKWVHEGGWEKAAERLTDPHMRQKIRTDIQRQAAETGQGVNAFDYPPSAAANQTEEDYGANVLIASVTQDSNKHLEGKTLTEASQLLKKDVLDVLFDLLLAEEGAASMVKFSMSEEDIQTAAQGSLAMVGSDGLAIANDGVFAGGKPHPRSYGSFPRVLAKYHREEQLFSLEEAVHKMTQLPAQKMKLKDRGTIRDGAVADVVVFDPLEIKDTASFTDPHRYAQGVHSVFVNGAKAYDQGTFLDPKSGEIVQPSADLMQE